MSFNSSQKGNLVPVYREILADEETPVSALMKIGRQPYAFLLESVEGGEKWGRYTFLGADPRAVFRLEHVAVPAETHVVNHVRCQAADHFFRRFGRAAS